jgi:hypothetical protein
VCSSDLFNPASNCIIILFIVYVSSLECLLGLVSFTTFTTDLTYKGIEYSVEIKNYPNLDVDYTVFDLYTGDKLHNKAPIVDEIINYIEKNVDLAN